MAQCAIDDNVGIPVRVCVTLSSELNADCVGYLPGFSWVISGFKNQVFDPNLPLPLLARVAVDSVCSPRGRCRIPIRVLTLVHRFFVF